MVGALGILALSAALVAISPQIGGIVAGVLALVGVIAFIWFMLRMSLVFPATIGAKKIGLAESWRITKGNVWRLLFYWILWGIVFIVVGCIVLVVALPQYIALFGEMASSATDPAAIQEIEQRMTQMQIDMWDRAKPGFWLYLAGNYVATILYIAVVYAAGGVAYRYIAGKA
jgi:hypothetical protein